MHHSHFINIKLFFVQCFSFSGLETFIQLFGKICGKTVGKHCALMILQSSNLSWFEWSYRLQLRSVQQPPKERAKIKAAAGRVEEFVVSSLCHPWYQNRSRDQIIFHSLHLAIIIISSSRDTDSSRDAKTRLINARRGLRRRLSKSAVQQSRTSLLSAITWISAES